MLDANTLFIKLSSNFFLKSEGTRHYFAKKLRENITCALKRSKVKFERISIERYRAFVYSKNLDSCSKVLRKVFGIHSIAPAYECEFSDIDELALKAVAFFEGRFKKKESFAVECSRTGLHYFSSQDVERKLGASIVKAYGLKVNLKKPDKLLSVEIHNNKAWIYVDEIKCFGGLPIGVEGNIAMFFYGQREELACAWLLLRKGCNVFPIAKAHREKIANMIKKLVPWNSYRNFRISAESELDELIEKYGIDAMATADKKTTKKAFEEYAKFNSKLPVLRPLLFLDKAKIEEIMRLFNR